MNANKIGDPAVVVTRLRLGGPSNCGVSIPSRVKRVASCSSSRNVSAAHEGFYWTGAIAFFPVVKVARAWSYSLPNLAQSIRMLWCVLPRRRIPTWRAQGKFLPHIYILYIEDLEVNGRIILHSIVTNRVTGFKLCFTMSEWGSETSCCGNGYEPCGS